MDKIIHALVPAFAAGFAVQQLLELVDAIFFGNVLGANKKAVLAWISFLAGLGLSIQIRVLSVLEPTVNPVIDVLVSALVISAGTEGVNSILKFLAYKKEEQKAAAAQGQQNAGADALSLVNKQPALPDLDLPAPTAPAV